MGRGSSQVVSGLAFIFDDQSSNPAKVKNFSVKLVVNDENEQKSGPRAGVLV